MEDEQNNSRQEEKERKDPRLSVEQFENMTPQQLAQLLGNLIRVLQRMPNEPLKNLQRVERPLELEQLNELGRNIGSHPPKKISEHKSDLPDWLSQ